MYYLSNLAPRWTENLTLPNKGHSSFFQKSAVPKELPVFANGEHCAQNECFNNIDLFRVIVISDYIAGSVKLTMQAKVLTFGKILMPIYKTYYIIAT